MVKELCRLETPSDVARALRMLLAATCGEEVIFVDPHFEDEDPSFGIVIDGGPEPEGHGARYELEIVVQTQGRFPPGSNDCTSQTSGSV
jgi:hypothetical protein